MIAYVFTSLAKAQAVAASMDTAMGYPIPGTDIGGGVHAPAAQSVTSTYFVPLPHPTLPQWAYISDSRVTQHVGPNAISLGLGVPQTLDATWVPTAAVGVGP